MTPDGAISPRDRTTNETEMGFAVHLAPSPARRLSGGLVVDASILARLLGMRLLRLEAHVTFVPADFSAPADGYPPQALDQPTAASLDGDLGDAVDLLAHASRTLVTIDRAGPAGLTP